MLLNLSHTEMAADSPVGIAEKDHEKVQLRLRHVLYGAALLISISVWFLAIRFPLWLDETVSFWQISGGFRQIWSRQGASFPAYSYILWVTNLLFGHKEIVLRAPSILAMCAALYALYRSARLLFDRESAFISAIIFGLHPVVVFAAIDARPYACGILVTTCSILLLLQLRSSSSASLAIAFGIASAGILYFHYLFSLIYPAYLLVFLAAKRNQPKILRRQLCLALASFAVTCLPIIPHVLYLGRTSESHVFEQAPVFKDFITTLIPQWWLLLFGVAALVSTVAHRAKPLKQNYSAILICASLAFIPLVLLYDVS